MYDVDSLPSFGEDAFEEFAGWFDIGMLLAPVFGQLPFDGGFEDGSFVAFEVGFDALEVGDCFVEAGELLFDLLDRVVSQRFLGDGVVSQRTESVFS